MTKIGYARVSTADQDLGRQVQALEAAGCDTIFQEKRSGVKERAELNKLLETVKAGDVVIVQKLDRLGRSLRHLLQIVELFKEKQVGFVSLNDSFDTTSSQGRLIFQIMGAIAEFERTMIIERVKDGLRYAKSQGQTLGQPRKDLSAEKADVKRLLESGMKREEIQTLKGWTKYKYYAVRRYDKDKQTNFEEINA